MLQGKSGFLFLILAPLIYIQSLGSVLFSQMRVGRNGKLFRIYKFRSMYLDAEERKKALAEFNEIKDGRMFKIKNDPRIIGSEKGPGKGIGNFIRRISLDEWEMYNPYHRGRMSIKPGLIGMWQVSGRSDVLDFEKVVE